MTWERIPLGEVGTWYGGGTPAKSNASFWSDGSIPWLSPKDMGPEVLGDTQDHITPDAVAGSAARLVPAPSVAVVTRSGILERRLPVALVPFVTAMNQDMKAVVPREGIDPRWVAWGLRAFERDLLRVTRKAGTTVASIEFPRLQQFELPVPSLDEQRHIVELVEGHLSRLDAAKKESDSAVWKLEALARASWKRAFVNTGVDPAQLLDVATIANGQTPKGLADRLVDQPSATTVPFYKVGDMNAGDGRYMSAARGHVESTDATSLGLHIRDPGTVLIPKRGGAIATNKKRILTGSAAYDLNMMGLVPSAALQPLYLWHWLQGVDLGKLADGSQVPQINAPQVRSLSLPVPSRDVQAQIVVELERGLDVRARLMTAAVGSRRRGDQLRRALLTAAFSGDLSVRAASVA